MTHPDHVPPSPKAAEDEHEATQEDDKGPPTLVAEELAHNQHKSVHQQAKNAQTKQIQPQLRKKKCFMLYLDIFEFCKKNKKIMHFQ